MKEAGTRGMKMTLLERVHKMRLREGKATKRPWLVIEDKERPGEFMVISNKDHPIWSDKQLQLEKISPDAALITELRNNAPSMLGVLAGFQADDGEKFLTAIVSLVTEGKIPRAHRDELTSMFRRYQSMAERMVMDD